MLLFLLLPPVIAFHFNAPRPPATGTAPVKQIEIERVGIGEAGKRTSATAIFRGIHWVNVPVVIEVGNQTSDTPQYLRLNHGGIHIKVGIAL